jgi:hypothetical protein
MNTKTKKNSRTGLKGVLQRKGHRWQARVNYEGKRISLGSFNTPGEAHMAYCEAARALHGDFFNYDDLWSNTDAD